MIPFAELYAKSNFSFLEGASHPEEMIVQAKAHDYHALALVDRGGVYGAPAAHKIAKQTQMPFIVGAEVDIAPGVSIALLARHREGYGDLCELLSIAHQRLGNRSQKERLQALQVSVEELREKANGLILLLPVKKMDDSLLQRLRANWDRSLYLCTAPFANGKDEEQFQLAEELCKNWEWPVIASNRPLFHHTDRKPLHDVLTATRFNTSLRKAGFLLERNGERYLKTRAQLEKIYKGRESWMERTADIASEFHFSLDELRYKYPNEWLPAGETAQSYLAKLVEEGAQKRFNHQVPPAIRTQVAHEMKLICELQYADYFLTVWDIVRFARSKDILCQGRGSAANSTVCYLLGVTAIDPIRMNLLFERFISRERNEPPDIDIDFEHERREEVIQYIYERYGRHRAAITAEFICYRRRSSFREVAKAFEIPQTSVEKLLAFTHRRSLKDVAVADVQSNLPDVAPPTFFDFYRMSRELLGFPRHVGTHVGGFVLSQDGLNRNVPIEKTAMENRTIVQWDKNCLDDLGFVRVDVLGLGILTCIRKSFTYIKETHGKELTLATVPKEDPKVYEMMSRGDTVGVFQIESRAQMNMLPRLRPKNFFDLVVEISLVRPGPIQGEMVHPYLRRRAGKEPVEYAHPDLESILKKTYGVPLFQEQIMKMAMVVADFTAGEADELRRAMGTWRKDGSNRLSRMGEKFCKGLMSKGISQEFSERIFSQIEGFAEYGFPESHAASFAILAYVTAWLKLYYPDAFLIGLLNAQPMGFYSARTLIYDSERHGVKILGIDINRSTWDNRLESPGVVRLGFREISGFPKKIGKHIEQLHTEGDFTSLPQVIARSAATKQSNISLTKRDLFYLAGANAFESFGQPRRQVFWEIQGLNLQDSPLFSPEGNEKVEIPKENVWERVAGDYEAQGVSIYEHPMALWRPTLKTRNFLSSAEIQKAKEGSRVSVGGMVVCRQMPETASGVLFVTLEDEFGFVNLVVWKKIFEQFRIPLITQSFMLCRGKLQRSEEKTVIHVILETVEPFPDLAPQFHQLSSHDFH